MLRAGGLRAGASSRYDSAKAKLRLRKRMLAKTENIAALVEKWLAAVEAAGGQPDDAAPTDLFHADSYWRDALALTWDIRTVHGADAIAQTLRTHADRLAPTGFHIDPRRMAPRHVTRVGTNVIEAMFVFETREGQC